MTLVKCKVIGPLEVAGAAPGTEVDIDDELVNIPALVQGGHVEVLVLPTPAPPAVAVEPEPGV